LRVNFALRRPCNEQILADMENFSTPPRAATPWIANLATLAVVIGAIGWSGVQRPAGPATEVASTPPAVPQALPVSEPAPGNPPTHLPVTPQARWPIQTTSMSVDGLQVVGLQTGRVR
jgi:hypothetical protein